VQIHIQSVSQFCTNTLNGLNKIKMPNQEHAVGNDRNLLCMQIPNGGWFPLALAAAFFFLACLWFWGMTKLLHHVNHMASQQAVDQMSSSEKAVDGELHRASGLLQTACLAMLIGNGMICACLSVIRSVCHMVCLSCEGSSCTVKTDLQVIICCSHQIQQLPYISKCTAVKPCCMLAGYA